MDEEGRYTPTELRPQLRSAFRPFLHRNRPCCCCQLPPCSEEENSANSINRTSLEHTMCISRKHSGSNSIPLRHVFNNSKLAVVHSAETNIKINSKNKLKNAYFWSLSLNTRNKNAWLPQEIAQTSWKYCRMALIDRWMTQDGCRGKLYSGWEGRAKSSWL